MLNEINTAVEFIIRLLKTSGASAAQMEAFKASLKASLTTKFASHWSPSEPMKGNAYRSILVTQGFIDPLLMHSAKAAGLATLDKRWFPSELVIWIDPLEVTYRIGDHGSVAALPIELTLSKAAVQPTLSPPHSLSPLPSSSTSLGSSPDKAVPLSPSSSPSPSPVAAKDSPMPIEVR